MTLAELIEKVEGLTGPDREVDALVWSATLPRDGNGLDGYGLPENAWFEYEADDRGAVTMYAIVGGESFKRAKRPAPELTTSLDAAVALCERVLPGHLWHVMPAAITLAEGRAKDLARFYVLATLRALQNQERPDAS